MDILNNLISSPEPEFSVKLQLENILERCPVTEIASRQFLQTAILWYLEVRDQSVSRPCFTNNKNTSDERRIPGTNKRRSPKRVPHNGFFVEDNIRPYAHVSGKRILEIAAKRSPRAFFFFFDSKQLSSLIPGIIARDRTMISHKSTLKLQCLLLVLRLKEQSLRKLAQSEESKEGAADQYMNVDPSVEFFANECNSISGLLLTFMRVNFQDNYGALNKECQTCTREKVCNRCIANEYLAQIISEFPLAYSLNT